jgi:exopolysaccharide biosynthesis polyprenyl glycosylphosphotransferase
MAVTRRGLRDESVRAPRSTVGRPPSGGSERSRPTVAPPPTRPGLFGRVHRPKLFLIGSDAIFLAIALIAAREVAIRVRDSAEAAAEPVALAVCFAAVLAGLAQQRVYRARYLALRRDEWPRIVRGVAIGVALTIVAGFVLRFAVPAWLVWLLVTGSVLICFNREIARRVFNRMRIGGRMVRKAVVVGANMEADELSMMLMTSKELGYEVAASVDTTGPAGMPLPWRTVLESVEKTLDETNAGNVILVPTAIDLDTAGYLTRRLTDAGLDVEMCMPLRDIDVTRLQLRPLGRFPVFYVQPIDRSGWRQSAKRAFDVVLASIVLLFLSPVIAVAALAIKLTSPGRVIFRQQRVGRAGEPFDVLKLRTMVADAESRLDEVRDLNEATGPIFKIRNDPRITKVGRVLRKLSVDELPQLWNVIRGEMSLVGPRPALPSEMELWTTDLQERLRVRPGITGMWQVSGRADSTGGDYVRLDLYYVDNWSLLIDLIILLKTVPAVLSGRGAY